jgi:hypothetical protein
MKKRRTIRHKSQLFELALGKYITARCRRSMVRWLSNRFRVPLWDKLGIKKVRFLARAIKVWAKDLFG